LRDREADSQTGRQIYKWRDREATARQIDKWRDREADRKAN
jgi:hypothetical protein